MSAPSEKDAPPVTAGKKRARKFRIGFAVVALLVLSSAVLSFIDFSNSRMDWITPADLKKASQPGFLLQLRYRISMLSAPIKRAVHWRPTRKALVRFDSQVFTVPITNASQFNLGVAASTNADGLRAWILSAPQLAAFNQQLKTMSNAISGNRARMEAPDGVRCQTSVGNSVNIGGSFVQTGLTIDLLPKVENDFLKLLVAFTVTEAITNVSFASPSLKTNFAIACRATVPNAGALVIDGGQVGQKRRWLVLEPIRVDAAGRPLLPRY